MSQISAKKTFSLPLVIQRTSGPTTVIVSTVSTVPTPEFAELSGPPEPPKLATTTSSPLLSVSEAHASSYPLPTSPRPTPTTSRCSEGPEGTATIATSRSRANSSGLIQRLEEISAPASSPRRAKSKSEGLATDELPLPKMLPILKGLPRLTAQLPVEPSQCEAPVFRSVPKSPVRTLSGALKDINEQKFFEGAGPVIPEIHPEVEPVIDNEPGQKRLKSKPVLPKSVEHEPVLPEGVEYEPCSEQNASDPHLPKDHAEETEAPSKLSNKEPSLSRPSSVGAFLNFFMRGYRKSEGEDSSKPAMQAEPSTEATPLVKGSVSTSNSAAVSHASKGSQKLVDVSEAPHSEDKRVTEQTDSATKRRLSRIDSDTLSTKRRLSKIDSDTLSTKVATGSLGHLSRAPTSKIEFSADNENGENSSRSHIATEGGHSGSSSDEYEESEKSASRAHSKHSTGGESVEDHGPSEGHHPVQKAQEPRNSIGITPPQGNGHRVFSKVVPVVQQELVTLVEKSIVVRRTIKEELDMVAPVAVSKASTHIVRNLTDLAERERHCDESRPLLASGSETPAYGDSTDGLQSSPGRRKLLLRKTRNVALRPTLLKAMLGRQLAVPTKEGLRCLAHGEQLPQHDDCSCECED